jgi:hypothetical protein
VYVHCSHCSPFAMSGPRRRSQIERDVLADDDPSRCGSPFLGAVSSDTGAGENGRPVAALSTEATAEFCPFKARSRIA